MSGIDRQEATTTFPGTNRGVEAGDRRQVVGASGGGMGGGVGEGRTGGDGGISRHESRGEAGDRRRVVGSYGGASGGGMGGGVGDGRTGGDGDECEWAEVK